MKRLPIRTRAIATAVAAALAASAAGAAFASTQEHESAAEVAAVVSAKVTLAQAIAAAEKATGGHALKIAPEKQGADFVYKVKTATADKVVTAFVSAADAKVIRTQERGAISRLLDREDRDEIARLVAAPTTLASAVAAAERDSGGKAVEAEAEHENGKVGFEVEVAKGSDVTKVHVDADSGKVTPMTAAEHDDDDED
jgi:uncharacterized membrane protein YkoI